MTRMEVEVQMAVSFVNVSDPGAEEKGRAVCPRPGSRSVLDAPPLIGYT